MADCETASSNVKYRDLMPDYRPPLRMDYFLGFRSENNMLKHGVVTVASKVPIDTTPANHLTWHSSDSVDGDKQKAPERTQAPKGEKLATSAPSSDPRDDVQMRQVDPTRVPTNEEEIGLGA